MKIMKKVTLKDRASEIIEGWKKEVNELKTQIQHSRDDAMIAFENQKTNLLEWIDEAQDEFVRIEGIGEDKAKIFKGNLEELRVQAALGKMETRDALHDQQKKINLAIHNLKFAITNMEKEAIGDAKELLEKFNQRLEGYETKFEIYRLQLNDRKEGVAQLWDLRKDKIILRLEKVKDKLEEDRGEASERWEGFSSEMKEAWSHFKKAVQGK